MNLKSLLFFVSLVVVIGAEKYIFLIDFFVSFLYVFCVDNNFEPDFDTNLYVLPPKVNYYLYISLREIMSHLFFSLMNRSVSTFWLLFLGHMGRGLV